jgi:uncharacterized membrane protein
VNANVAVKPVSAGWGVPAALMLLVALPLAIGVVRLSELAGGPKIMPANAQFVATPVPVVVHIVGAGVYALLGTLQFAVGFRRRRPGWHRAAGRLLVLCGLLAGLSGLWMTLFFTRPSGANELLYVFRLVFGSAMVAFLVLGFAAIRRGDVSAHRMWMTRAYAIGLGAATQVLTLLAGSLILGASTKLSEALLIGAAWVINLAVAEWSIRRRTVQRRSASFQSVHGRGAQ